MNNSVGGADIAQELVTQALAFRGALHQARDVDNFHSSRHHAGGMFNLHQFIQALVGDGNNAHVRLNGAKRKVSGLSFSVAQTVEKCRLADIRQTYYSTLKRHLFLI